MRAVRLHDAARLEAADAAGWFESKGRGLGVEFRRELDERLDLLEQSLVYSMPVPEYQGERMVRRLLIRRFKYQVIFVERDDEILVVAVAHYRRKPGYWRDRLK